MTDPPNIPSQPPALDQPAAPAPDLPSWRRKTPEEMVQHWGKVGTGRLNPVLPLIVGLIGAAVGAGIGLAVCLRNGESILWFLIAVLAGVFGVPAFVLSYAMQAAGWLSMPPWQSMGICNRCFEVTNQNRDRCECGGAFEDIDGWTRNFCPNCGYDLRGTPGRCPECGTQILPFWPAPPGANKDKAP